MSKSVIEVDFKEQDQLEATIRAALSAKGRGAAKEILLTQRALLRSLLSSKLHVRRSILIELAATILACRLKLRENADDREEELLKQNFDNHELEQIREQAKLLFERGEATGGGCGD